MTYYIMGQELETTGEALAVVRGDEIIGSDPWGGVFEGRIAAGGDAGEMSLRVGFKLPPGGCLVTGLSAGDGGAIVEITGESHAGGFKSVQAIDVGGSRVDVQLRYIGELPLKKDRLRQKKPAGYKSR
ncbi:MAG: hypothetical protein K0U74_05205 [Alphaproteobacteria bacterium]|nr:hypothetical protein [Alphaproteobacteria bacterium]